MQTIALNDMVNKIAEALSIDADMNAWCMEKYDKPITVFIGWDGKAPPTKDSCPYCVILPRGKEESYVSSYNEYSLFLGFAVYDRDSTVDGNVVKSDCVVNGLAFGQKIMEIVDSVGNYHPSSIEMETDSVIEFPIFQGAIEVAYNIEKSIGGSLSF